jgi:glycosyltransferase involved in cell wall biosynthesis
MKILFDHPNPFLLAHGGFQVQIEETKRALEKLGMTVEYLRWWDEGQTGDIIHFFGRASSAYVDLAHSKNFRLVMADLLTGLGSRSSMAIAFQKGLIHMARSTFPSAFLDRMGWDAYVKADRIVALTNWEAELMQRVFGAPVDRITVIPNGVAEEFLRPAGAPLERGEFLVCTATITERKRVLEMAEAAVCAKTPIWIVGKPYHENDLYAQRFFQFAKQNAGFIRYEGAVQERQQLARIYRQARGFVLLSTEESLSLSALEAAACDCPMLLSDLPWARTVFKEDAKYCPVAPVSRTAQALREFYDAAPSLRPTFKPLSWDQVGGLLQRTYEDLLSASR